MFSFFRKKKAPPPVAFQPPPPVPPLPERRSPEVAALRHRTSEDLCGIAPGMGGEEIHARLARLFRRHNRAASSLDEGLRAEAEIMLEAIVDIRLRYLEKDEDGPGGAGR